MTPLQQAQIRAGELRKRLAVIGGMAELTDEIRSEFDTLRKEYDDLETRQAALIIAGDGPTTPLETRSGEGREFQELITRSNVGEIFDAAINHNAVTGPTAELQQHYGLDANSVPLALLIRSWPGEQELETRAVSPAPSNVGQNQQSIIPYVFPMSAAAFLMVDSPTVGVGEAVFPVLTSTLSVRTPAENADADETTGAFSAEVLSPSRIQASFFYSREDRARFAGMDSSLRENLSMGLEDGFDDQILSGTNGLFTGTNLANHDVTDATTFDLYMSNLAYNRVDGRYANNTSDLKMVVGTTTYAHMGETYRNTTVDRSVLDRMMEVSNGVRVSAHVPAAASNRQNVAIKLGSSTGMVAPIWEGIQLIDDQVTQAKKGQIVVTAVMLHAVKVIRAASYFKQQIQTA